MIDQMDAPQVGVIQYVYSLAILHKESIDQQVLDM